MKKLLVLFSLLISSVGFSQKYASVGAGLSEGTVSYGVEVGVFNDKRWSALTFDHIPSTKEMFVGFKYYRKVVTIEFFEAYLAGATKVETKKFSLAPEIGTAFVFNINEHWAPQYGLAFSLYKGYGYFSQSIGINYF